MGWGKRQIPLISPWLASVILQNFEFPHPFPSNSKQCREFSPAQGQRSQSIPLYSPTYSPGWPGVLPQGQADDMCIREISKQSVQKRKADNPELVRKINKQSVRKGKADNPGHVREINKQSVRRQKINNPESVREINKQSVRKRKADKPELVRETNKKSFKKKKANNPEYIIQINRNSKEKLNTLSCFHTASAADETLFHDLPNESHVAFGSDRLQAQKNKDTNAISMINLFHKNIAHGPEYVCTCCDQLWYKSSVVKCDAKKIQGMLTRCG